MSAVSRLIKEEASYHKELQQQEARIANFDAAAAGENAEFQLKQEVGRPPASALSVAHDAAQSRRRDQSSLRPPKDEIARRSDEA
ncbi:hypothetical protein MRB53_037040 [Persea americana]|nr:hypothetical protein MRB53_037040 [Persea americana]